MMNQIFGYQIFPEDTEPPILGFDGAYPVDVPFTRNGESPQVKLFAYPDTTLQTSYSRVHRAWTYIWGMTAHLEVPQAALPDWCAGVVAEENFGLFKELLGTYVIIVDEPSRNRVTFISDVLGVRPMFLAHKNGRVIFGSKVWPIYQTGLISGNIDYNSVSSWISYGFNCSNGSLFTDLRRLPSGSAVMLQHGKCEETPYAQFEAETPLQMTNKVDEELHEIVSSTLTVLLSNIPQATLALSGGYDSRYLLALSLSLSKAEVKCATVNNTREEGYVARQVAEILGVSLETFPMPNSQWDLYDEMFHFSADGFPISKFLTHCLAQAHPKIPMLNGYMGDSLMRGSKDTFLGKYEEEYAGDLVDILQRKYLFVSPILFRPEIAQKIQLRSRLPMEEVVRKGADIGKIFGWADFYFRQRFYISNNFLQHLDRTEALLPFYSWALLSYKMRHNCRIFNSEVYEKIFTKFFPALSKIPHADNLPHTKPRYTKVARCTKQWARNLFPVLCSKNDLILLNKKWCIPRTFAGWVGFRRYEGTIHNFQRLYLLEERAKSAGLNFDWEQI